jgi:prevent-host-death family protein
MPRWLLEEAQVTEVGIRELKAKASQILDEVREQGARFVITRRGRPVGVLLPVEQAPPAPAAGAYQPDAWRELERLGEEIGREWTSRRTSGEILSDLRR